MEILSYLTVITLDIMDIVLELLQVLSPYIVAFTTWLAVQLSGIVRKLPGISVVLISGLVGAVLQLVNLWVNNPDIKPIYAVGLGFLAVFISQFLKQIQSQKIAQDKEEINSNK